MDSVIENSDRLKVVSLFSGCGGLDLGFVMSGHYEIKFAGDIKDDAANTYAYNFGAEIIRSLSTASSHPLFFLGNIKDLDFSALKLLYPDPDVVIGGPPCQDFSLARGTDLANAGIGTERGRLYAYFVKALIFLRPKYFVFENVPGIISDNKGETWNTIKEDFKNLSIHVQDIEKIAGDGFDGANPGYFLAYAGVVDASAIGVPQRRKRVLAIGVRKDLLEKATGGLHTNIAERVKELCREKIKGDGSLFPKYPLTAIEAFEGYPLNALQQNYEETMAEWLINKANDKIRAMKKWELEHSAELTKNIMDSYCDTNGFSFDPHSILNAMTEHEMVLKELGFYGRNVCHSTARDGSCNLFSERSNVVERLFYTPPDENYKFLYKYRRFRVEGKGISMIYKRLHPLKPAYTVTANGGGGTHGYHYERGRSRLTIREIARLQSFPDSFIFVGSKKEVKKQIGEAVPPLLGMKAAEAVWLIEQTICKQLKPVSAEPA